MGQVEDAIIKSGLKLKKRVKSGAIKVNYITKHGIGLTFHTEAKRCVKCEFCKGRKYYGGMGFELLPCPVCNTKKETKMEGYTEEDIKNILTDMFEKAIPDKKTILELVTIIANRYI